MSSRGPDPHFGSIGDLREKAIGEAERAIQHARAHAGRHASAEAFAAVWVTEAAFGLVNAVLAVADRLDVLIGLAFEERRPIFVAPHDPDDDGDRVEGGPGPEAG